MLLRTSQADGPRLCILRWKSTAVSRFSQRDCGVTPYYPITANFYNTPDTIIIMLPIHFCRKFLRYMLYFLWYKEYL
jgi:hypothetical protein